VTVFFTITLLLSCAGMIMLLALKRYELRTNRMLFAQVRPALGGFFSGALVWVERVLPALAAKQARRAYARARAAVRAAVAHGAIIADHLLERALHALRRGTLSPRGEASPFLREVAEHKKKLLEDRVDE
jgi:hypothetical protein